MRKASMLSCLQKNESIFVVFLCFVKKKVCKNVTLKLRFFIVLWIPSVASDTLKLNAECCVFKYGQFLSEQSSNVRDGQIIKKFQDSKVKKQKEFYQSVTALDISCSFIHGNHSTLYLYFLYAWQIPMFMCYGYILYVMMNFTAYWWVIHSLFYYIFINIIYLL